MKLRTGDTVLVIAGKDRGKTGNVLRVLHGKERLVVEGVMLRTRHIRKTPQRPGQIVRYEASIAAANVMLLDPDAKKPTRIGFMTEGGGKWRIGKRSGQRIDSGKKKREKKEALPVEQKKTEGKVEEQKGEKVVTPPREPFWKRAFRRGSGGGGAKEGGEGGAQDHQEEYDRSAAHNLPRSRES